MKSKLKNIAWIAILCFCLLTSVSVVLQRLSGVQNPMVWGWGIAFVETGSMEPNIPVGSLIVIHEQDTYRRGDVVTYLHKNGQFTVTHRIIHTEDGVITTQGDANDSPDPSFMEDRIIGRVALAIPYLGYVLAALQSPVVLIMFFGLGLLIIILDSRRNRSK